ncbi:MAG: hypothetical protein JSW14_04995 [Candidatus Bathyarchaeum sp.]|nr:MAG: hypothetical protein JSW14_04995 [Candidatus Bathyarchaeum sp.]
MNRKILGLVVALLSFAMFATPVLAFGPEKAVGKNPNLTPDLPYCEMLLDIRGNAHGVVHGWITITPFPMYELDLDASIFEIKNAFVVTEAVQVFGMENKWLYLSQSMQYDFLILSGMPPEVAADIISFHPEGVYMKWNFVGQ